MSQLDDSDLSLQSVARPRWTYSSIARGGAPATPLRTASTRSRSTSPAMRKPRTGREKLGHERMANQLQLERLQREMQEQGRGFKLAIEALRRKAEAQESAAKVREDALKSQSSFYSEQGIDSAQGYIDNQAQSKDWIVVERFIEDWTGHTVTKADVMLCSCPLLFVVLHRAFPEEMDMFIEANPDQDWHANSPNIFAESEKLSRLVFFVKNVIRVKTRVASTSLLDKDEVAVLAFWKILARHIGNSSGDY